MATPGRICERTPRSPHNPEFLCPNKARDVTVLKPDWQDTGSAVKLRYLAPLAWFDGAGK